MRITGTIQQRRDTAASWTSKNSVLASGERGLETDTGKEKMGDGSTAWTALRYLPGEEGVVALVDGAHISVDGTKGHRFKVQLTDDRILDFPSGLVDGQCVLFEIQQAAAGGKAITFASGYVFTASLPAPVLTSAANYIDLFAFIYRASVGKLFVVLIDQGFDGTV
jgi:hypothetical protein